MKKAFTLAEMMVVMLILSIVLAAMAPVMTTRNKTEQTSPWRYSEGNLSDAYYGLGEIQTAMIGQREFETTDEPAKLIIDANSKGRGEHIAFKFDRTNQGVLRVNNNSVLLGSLNNGGSIGTNSVAIGSSVNADENSIAIGKSSKAGKPSSVAVGYSTEAEGEYSTAVGYGAAASGKGSIALGGGGALEQPTASANGSVAIGYALSSGSNALAIGPGGIGSSMDSRTRATGSTSIAIGGNAQSTKGYSVSLGVSSRSTEEYAMAIGTLSTASAEKSLALGYSASSSAGNAIAVGTSAEASYDSGISIGYDAEAGSTNSVAIGRSAQTGNSDAIAIGHEVSASGESSIAIGSVAGDATTTASGEKAIAIGDGAVATGSASIAIGNYAEAKGNNNTAIGNFACKGVTGTNKTCIGANSGPVYEQQRRDTSVESIYIGSAGHFKRFDDRWESDTNGILELNKSGDKAIAILNADLVVRGDLITMPRKKSGGRDARFAGMKTKYIDNAIEFDDGVREWNIFDSDKRLKYVGKENLSGLDKIRQLKVFNYTYKKDKNKTPHVGVIAQDLQKIFPDAVIKGKNGFLKIRMEDMFYAVINAIKELDARVTALEKENQILKEQNKNLDTRLKALEAKIK